MAGLKIYKRPEQKFALIQFENINLMIMELSKSPNSWNSYAPMEYPLGRGFHLQMEVTNINALYSRIKQLKIPLFRELKTNEYREHDKILRCNEFLIQDPDGYLLRFCTTSY